MNNIYVDFNELDVEDRPHYKCNKYILQVKSINSSSKYENIKLVSLTDRLAEERKKVVQEIKEKISDCLYRNSYGETFIDGDIYEILDQIERNDD